MRRLTPKCLRYAEPRPRPYRLSDGKGLALQVLPNGTKAWRYRYRFDGREKMISLGLHPAVPLEAARRLRDEACNTLKRGVDPSAARRARKQLESQTFEAVASEWLKHLSHAAEHGKVAAATLKRTNWLLKRYWIPALGPRPIRLIEPSEVLVVVKQIELRGLRNTPRRALQKCGQLFRYAAGLGAAERDITRDLAGLIERVPTEHPNITPASRIRGASASYCDPSIASIRVPPWDSLCDWRRWYSFDRLNSSPPNGSTSTFTLPSGASPWNA